MNNEMLIRRYQSALTKNTRKGAERIIQLERENKQLKDLLNKANDEVVSYSNCCIDLQQRIDKAIAYIKHDLEVNKDYKGHDMDMIYTKKWVYDTCNDLLNILGEINEN